MLLVLNHLLFCHAKVYQIVYSLHFVCVHDAKVGMTKWAILVCTELTSLFKPIKMQEVGNIQLYMRWTWPIWGGDIR